MYILKLFWVKIIIKKKYKKLVVLDILKWRTCKIVVAIILVIIIVRFNIKLIIISRFGRVKNQSKFSIIISLHLPFFKNLN